MLQPVPHPKGTAMSTKATTFRDELVSDMFDAAPSSIAYFCQEIEWVNDDTLRFVDEDDDEKTITRDEFRSATYKWAEWAAKHYKDNMSRWAQYQRKAANDWRFKLDEFDYDSDTVDMITQFAAFGEVVYG